ncbi:SP_1767 family glycosyltransferase [Bacillus sp. B1-b2]|uniref:SP_1767 family glycosyltransferase n=1 Tax=Bacillus sp. B1-b2 TaxID=2653201 RepID=UPI00186AA7A5|nr:SP_1767 family glycosyltransferase [Bacillus sp. B1-b2]
MKKFARNIIYTLKYKFVQKKIRFEKVKSIEETINIIVDTGASVSRFGDGEFKWIDGIQQDSFQKDSYELSHKLKEVLVNKLDNHLVCITPAFYDLSNYERESRKYWKITLAKYGLKWREYLDNNRTYYNADISRPYISLVDKSNTYDHFNLLKKIWSQREILIVEGENSRLGVGNDLFQNSLNISRIIAPAQNAFDKYDEILKSVCKFSNNKLVLLALGPTATILAYDLAKKGFQAVDIGHIDIEYEWFLMGATSKVPVRGKEVNEVKTNELLELDDDIKDKYLSEIVEYIK